jgi:GNAT superfamily N-acetyltransferase
MENLILATRADKKRILDILVTAFANDPQINWYVGEGPGKERRRRTLMEFSTEQGLANRTIYLTPDKNAVAIWRKSAENRLSLPLLFLYLKFIWVMGHKRVKTITQKGEEIAQRYPQDRPYWYLWLLGADPAHQGKGLSSQLLRPRLAEAEEAQLPVYLETTNPRNLPIYQKKGFEVYEQIELDAEKEIQLYFMRRAAKEMAFQVEVG